MFTPGEPACNVYTPGGAFPAHEDGHSLTVVLVLTDPASGRGGFDGGGTGFWCEAARPAWSRLKSWARDARHGRSGLSDGATLLRDLLLRDSATLEPTVVVRPPAGSALIFGGNVTHAAVAVDEGERAVLVASFSTRAEL